MASRVGVGWAIHQISPLIPYVTRSIFFMINTQEKMFSVKGINVANKRNPSQSILDRKVEYLGEFSRFRHIRLYQKISPGKPS